MRMLRLALVMACLPLTGFAQDAQTLADIRAEIGRLQADFNSLKSELVNSGAAATGVAAAEGMLRHLAASDAPAA